uniref:Uncharacterized protein n=1 Tax=Anopheles maculatus TaxID=74869 RepID=A0A182STW0_9DIPT
MHENDSRLEFDVLYCEEEFSTADPFLSVNGLMAFCNRTLAIKAALGAGFLLILLNLLNSKLDSGSGTNRYSPHLKPGYSNPMAKANPRQLRITLALVLGNR